MTLTAEALEYLKEEFTKKWPEAAKILRTATPGTNYHNAANTLWLGFKEGFELGCPEAWKE